MDEAGQRNRQRVLRHAAPERVRQLLDAYRRRAARDLLAHPTGSGRRTGRGQRSSGSGAASADAASRSVTGTSAG